MHKISLLALTLLWTFPSVGQVTKVKFYHNYDCNDQYFHFYLYVEEGKATDHSHRLQFNSNYSFIRPSNLKIDSIKRHFPLKDNKEYMGTTPMFWTPNNPTAVSLDGKDVVFQSMVPTLSPVAHYNDLHAGDTVALFSIKFKPIPDDVRDLVLFDNEGDYPSLSYDYTNGFTMGGLLQLYSGNLSSGIPDRNIDQTGSSLSVQEGFDEYVWVDCLTGQIVPDAVEHTYTASAPGSYRVRIRSGSCWYESDCVAVGTTAVADPKHTSSLSISPNPVSGFAEVSGLNLGDKIEIRDFTGRLIRRTTYDGGGMDFSDLPSGAYSIVQIQSGYSLYFIKL